MLDCCFFFGGVSDVFLFVQKGVSLFLCFVFVLWWLLNKFPCLES